MVDEGRVGHVISLSKTRFDSASVLLMTAEEVGKAVEICAKSMGEIILILQKKPELNHFF